MLVKKELSGIPLLACPKCDDEHAQVICPAQIVELPKSGRILVVDYYEPDEPHELVSRFFSDGTGWLTVREWPARSWTKQQPVTWLHTWRYGPNDAWSPEADAQLALAFLPTPDSFFAPIAAHNAANVVEGFINLRRKNAEKKAQESRNQMQDRHFGMYPNLPDDLPSFLDGRVFTHTYILISTSKAGVRAARCTHCGAAFEVPGSAKHGRNTTCPSCGRHGKFVADWYNPNNLVDVETVVINHKVGGDLLIRWTTCTRSISAPDFVPKFKFEDVGYNLHLHERGREKLYCYIKKALPYQTGRHWIRRPMGEPVIAYAHVYTGNLTEVFGAKHYNVDLADAFNGPSRPVLWNSILRCLRDDPIAEYLLKLRMPAMVGNVTRRKTDSRINTASLLRIDPNMVPICKDYNITPTELTILKLYGKPVSRRDFEALRRMGTIDTAPAAKVLKKMSFTKFVNYFANQPGKRRINTLMTEWVDYLEMAENLGLDLSRKGIRYPSDLHAAHQRIQAAFTEKQNAEKDAAFAAAVSGVYAKLPFTSYTHGKLLARLPASHSELIAEGNSLNHCVGRVASYAEKHKAGKNLIIFIRKLKNPDKPFLTMELRMSDFYIEQIHGYADRSATTAERAFCERFVKELAAAMTAGKEAAA